MVCAFSDTADVACDIRCAPWYYKDKVALVGDAAHAVVPFYGQGMNAAFEDCVVLDECLAEFPQDRQRAFAEYFQRRKENADALADWQKAATLARHGKLTPEIARDLIAAGVADVFATNNRESMGANTIRGHFDAWLASKEIESEGAQLAFRA